MGNELDTQLSLQDGNGLKNDIMRNPGLDFKHISKNKWIDFLKGIAANFEMNVPSTQLSKTVVDLYDDEDDDGDDDEKMESQNADNGKTKQIIESILDNTNFDIIRIHADEQKYDPENDATSDNKKKKKKKKKKVLALIPLL